jgi:external thioesterase TEII
MQKPQLFLIHFAGGSRYSFQFAHLLTDVFDVVPLELPGRGRRMNESLLYDFNAAARDICMQLEQKLVSKEFLIYGHSMGASLALKVCNLLKAKPLHLVLTGNAGPGTRADNKTYMLETGPLIERLLEMGGVTRELTDHRELFDFFEPMIRADFEIAEKNDLVEQAPVDVPILAVMGSEEEYVKQIDNWSKYTRAGFAREVLPGGHFFIQQHGTHLAALIRGCYQRQKVS